MILDASAVLEQVVAVAKPWAEVFADNPVLSTGVIAAIVCNESRLRLSGHSIRNPAALNRKSVAATGI